MKTVNQVLMTTDYNMFKNLNGNRNVNPLHLNRVKKSISEKYISVPIVVNDKYEIIDGQHRFESAKELEKPVYFIKIGGLELPDIHRLNSNLKNWQADDYLDGYCMLGYPEYIKYKEFKDKYKFGHSETKSLLSGTLRFGDRTQTDAFKDGTFKVRDLKTAEQNAEKLLMVSNYYDGYKRKAFIKAMLLLFNHDDYNHAEFLKKLEYQRMKLVDCTNYEQYLTLIEDIYNYNRAKENKVFFRF